MNARLINIEGAGGVGKSTCAKYLEERLRYTHGQNVRYVHWLKDTAVGRSVLEFFSDENNSLNVSSLSWLLLLYAARRQAMEEVIYPLTSTGVHVIVENYYDAAHVYLGAVMGLNETITQFENLSSVTELSFRPDHTVYLSCQGNLEFLSRKPFDEDSYPEVMERVSYGNRDQLLAAWEEHFTKVQLATLNDSCKIHVLDANEQLAQTKQHLDSIAAKIIT